MRYEKYKPIDLPWLKEVPKHWEVGRNKHHLISQKDLVGSNSSDYTLLSLTLQGIIKRDIESGKGKFPESFDSYKIVKPGNLVFCLFDIDETPRTVGLSKHEGMITGAYDVFDVKNMNPSFAEYYWLNVDNKKALKPYYKSLRKTITSDAFLSITMPIPPIGEQEQISKFLDWKTNEIDRLIKIKKKESQLLEEARKTIIFDAVTGKVYKRENISYKKVDIIWVKEIPEHWEIVPLKSLLKESFSGMWGNEKDTNLKELPCVRVADFKFNKIGIRDEIETLRYYKESELLRQIKKGDILIEKSGGGEKTPVGRIAYNEEFDNYMCANFIQVIRVKENINSKYIAYLLSAVYFAGYVELFIKQTTGIQNLSLNQYLSQTVFVPPKEEQDEITKFLDNKTIGVNKLIEIKNKEIVLLNDLKNKIISDAVTGQVDIRNINIPKYEQIEVLENEDIDLEEGEEEWD